jgi:hypothetical protein
MACPRRDSRHQNGITVRGLSQLTFATKSAMSRHTEAAQKKSRPWRLLNSNLMIVDQAAINAGFDFRRYAFATMLLGAIAFRSAPAIQELNADMSSDRA